MDSRREDFAKLIASQFAYLRQDASENLGILETAFDKFEPMLEKLDGFCESVLQTLVHPRHEIVVGQLGESAQHASSPHESMIVVAPTPEFPSKGKFKVYCELFVPEESITFHHSYVITTSETKRTTEDWFRFTIRTFGQNDFCNWLENGIVQFVNAKMKQHGSKESEH